MNIVFFPTLTLKAKYFDYNIKKFTSIIFYTIDLKVELPYFNYL
jgi:hypothetical protein